VKEAEEYTIKMAEKAQEEQSIQDELKGRYQVRLEFWKQHLQKFNRKSNLFSNISPSKDNWLSAGTGVSGVGFNFTISRTYARTEVYMSRSVAEENKFIFDKLLAQKETIENETGALEWERLDDKKACRIKQELNNVNLYEKDDWEKMSNFMIDSMLKLEPAFRKPLNKINNELKKEFKE
jgi:hypothetical protein